MPDIEKVKLNNVDYTIVDANALHSSDLPVGQIDVTLTSNSISDGTTTFAVDRLESTAVTSITLVQNQLTVVTGTPASMIVSLPAPASGRDYHCSVAFQAGADFAVSTVPPSGHAVIYNNLPTWTEGNLYIINYRCSWLSDTDSNVIITAVVEEFSS